MNWKISLFLVIALLGTAAFFEYSSAVEQARSYVSVENYQVHIGCYEVLDARPWYGRVNQWFFLWIILIPVLVFSAKLDSSAWIKNGRLVLSVLLGYGILNLMIHEQWDIRNAPFLQDPYHPDPVNGWRMDCVNFADGFSLILVAVMGWLPIAVYVAVCQLMWFVCHKYRSKMKGFDFKNDYIGKFLIIGLGVYILLICCFFGVLFLKNVLNFDLPHGYLSMAYYAIVRPMFIPTEIFIY